MLPRFQVDKGGVKFIFGGANVMAPGLLTSGGHMDEVEKDTIVAIYGEGKENAIAVGVTTMSTQEIRDTKQGIAVITYHHLNDKLYYVKDLSKKKWWGEYEL